LLWDVSYCCVQIFCCQFCGFCVSMWVHLFCHLELCLLRKKLVDQKWWLVKCSLMLFSFPLLRQSWLLVLFIDDCLEKVLSLFLFLGLVWVVSSGAYVKILPFLIYSSVLVLKPIFLGNDLFLFSWPFLGTCFLC
jgi:hypothetical protein